jgi:zinc transporter ZupT
VLGIYVGVLPVLLGLLWLPFLRRIGARWLDFFLAFTVGLLVFLGVDAIAEAVETAAAVAGAYQGLGLVTLGFLGAALTLSAAGKLPALGSRAAPAMYLATLIALGIGLHNLGEGLAIGSAYGTGEVALGTFLVLGFLIHNTTEGLAIVAPLASGGGAIRRLIGLGLLAGLPTIAGAWIGGLSYSPILTTLFFAIGAGAIAQVVGRSGGARTVRHRRPGQTAARGRIRTGHPGHVRHRPVRGRMKGASMKGASMTCASVGLLLALIAPAAAYAQDLVTDRPDFTESALTVPAGMRQLEGGYTFTPAARLIRMRSASCSSGSA